MFSQKLTTVLILTSKTLSFYSLQDEQKEVLTFPATLLKKQEIMDWDKFGLLVEEFLARNSFKKQHAVMILGKDVLFEKTFAKDKDVDTEDEEKFIKEVPFEKEFVVIKRLQDEDKTYLLATHKDFYSSVKYTLEKFGWNVDLVVPSTMFDGFENEKVLSFDEVKQILANAAELSVGDFLAGSETLTRSRLKEKTVTENTGFFRKGNIFFLLGISASCAIVVFLLLFFNIIKSPMPGAAPTPTPTPAPVVKATPTPQPLVKDDITVRVLNGTGTPGQAGKVKDALTDLGYKDITTDNADTSDAIDTTVEVSDKISKKDADAIVTELKKTFKTVKTKASADTSADIIITTGTEK